MRTRRRGDHVWTAYRGLPVDGLGSAAVLRQAVVREHLDSAQIPPHGADLVNDFCANHLNPYISFHHPCFFPETITGAKGKDASAIATEEMKTLCEKFGPLPYASQYLNPGLPVEQLNAQAASLSDNDAAVALSHARRKRF